MLDPITGLGISDALRDAELLSDAIVAGGKRALPDFHRARDRAARPAYDVTARLARLAPPRPAELALFTAPKANFEYADMFIAALTAAIPLRRFMSPAVIVRLIGVRGLFALLSGGRDSKTAGTPAVVTQ